MHNKQLLKFYERAYGPFVHMSENDRAIWLRYLMQGGAQFHPFAYDFRVGLGTQMPAGSNETTIRTAYALTTKRIDAMCIVNGRTRIIEVKYRAGLGSIGQLIGYRDLLAADRPGEPLADMFLVTDRLQPDMVHVLTENNIQYCEVGL